MSSNLPWRLALAFCSLALVACPTDDGDTTTETGQTETSGTGGGLDDSICELEDPYACECLLLETDWVPAGIVYGEPDLAAQQCFHMCHNTYPGVDDTKITPVNCSEVPPQTDCSDWPPARTISFDEVSGVYFVARSLVERLMLDPTPLRTCDDAILVPVDSGGCQVVGADSGELLHELGLRNDDVLLSLNQYPLHTVTDAIVAFSKLWSNGAKSFELELRRDRRLVTLSYRLVKP